MKSSFVGEDNFEDFLNKIKISKDKKNNTKKKIKMRC